MPTISHKYETKHEPIDVKITTRQGKTRVEEFYWKQQRYVITEQCLINKAARGRTPVWLFSVATDSGSYQLRFDTDTLHWWLEQTYSEMINT